MISSLVGTPKLLPALEFRHTVLSLNMLIYVKEDHVLLLYKEFTCCCQVIIEGRLGNTEYIGKHFLDFSFSKPGFGIHLNLSLIVQQQIG